MKLLPVFVASALALGGGGGYLFWDGVLLGVDSAPPAFVDCEDFPTVEYTPDEIGNASGVARVHFINERDPADVTICVFEGSGPKRYQEEFRIDGASEKWFEFPIRAGDVAVRGNAQSAVRYAGGSTNAVLDIRWCFQQAGLFTFETDYYEHRSSTSGDGRCSAKGQLVNEAGGEVEPASAPKTTWVTGGPPGGAVAAGAGGVLLLGLAWSHWTTIRALAAGLFTRLRRPTILDHAVRADIVSLVTEEPGLHGREIRRRLATAEGQTRYHLRVLVREHVLSGVRTGGRIHYFVHGSAPPRRLLKDATLRSRAAKRTFRTIREHPGISVGDLAKELGTSAANASQQSERLATAGLIERRRKGRFVELHPVNEADAA